MLRLDIAGLPAGVYLISLRSGDKERHARMVVQSPCRYKQPGMSWLELDSNQYTTPCES